MSGQPGSDVHMRDTLRRIEDQVGKVADAVSEMKPQTAGIEATLKHVHEQFKEQIPVLHKRNDELDKRVRDVEQDYVPKEDHKDDMDKNEREHTAFSKALDDQRTFGGRVSGGVAVAALLLGAVLTWLVGHLGG